MLEQQSLSNIMLEGFQCSHNEGSLCGDRPNHVDEGVDHFIQQCFHFNHFNHHLLHYQNKSQLFHCKPHKNQDIQINQQSNQIQPVQQGSQQGDEHLPKIELPLVCQKKQSQIIELYQPNNKNKKTTKCFSGLNESVLEKPQLSINNNNIADFSSTNNSTQNQQEREIKKKVKISKKASKFILKEKKFGKALKISFPKKIVQMFLNHYESFQIQNLSIKVYNQKLKQKLKQNKKNDYTFDKDVAQILGQRRQVNDLQLAEEKQISFINRRIFNQIIRTKMKQEVIMRDKIAKNRQLYMIQLKVYALRNRSHKLSKKGTYK